MTKHHYVYHSYEEWGREYIGCRTCDCLPEEDTNYFGSFYDKTFKPTEKTILFVCETRIEALEIEIELHNFFNVAVNPKFANQVKQTNTGFDTTGVPQTEEHKKKKSVAKTGKTLTEETKKKISMGMSGENNPQYGKTGALSPRSRAIIVIRPDDTEEHFVSGREAARKLKINKGSLCGYLKSGKSARWGKLKDWKFLYKTL